MKFPSYKIELHNNRKESKMKKIVSKLVFIFKARILPVKNPFKYLKQI